MEACAGSHYWEREISKQGHTVRLMEPEINAHRSSFSTV
jgi:transposase